MHREQRTTLARRVSRTVGALVAFGSLAVLAACSFAPAPTLAYLPPPAKLSFSHGAGEVDVSPAKQVVVNVEDGTLEAVSLAADGGEPGQIEGEFDEDRLAWSSVTDLAYGTTYALSVTSRGEDGEQVAEVRTFTTLAVNDGFYYSVAFRTSSRGYAVPLEGGTFGVGQPIVAVFNDVPDKAIAEAALTVATTPAVEGAWSWISDREAHWRPRVYWPAGTQVTVEANILGVKLTSPDRGRELWGKGNVSASFTIGKSRIAKVDNNTKQMQVYIDGELVRTIPVSLGRDGTYLPATWTNPETGRTQHYRTYSGIHVVTIKHLMYTMSGVDAGGPWEVDVPHAVRITDSGVFVHSASWSVQHQGVRNVSHGCVNISPANAEWFYNEFGPGDVVDIVNTGRELYDGNGTTDWNESWDEWLAGSALHGASSAS